MPFIEPIAEQGATGEVAALYEEDRADQGYVSNSTAIFSLRPSVLAAWVSLKNVITASMDRRRYELATLAAARRLRSSYCMLGHGSVLA
jgi:alkylhydroperoxidase family enzyme